MKIDKKFLISVASGWWQFKNGHVKDAYICYSKNDEKYLDFVMEKNSWYYGQSSYSIFENGRYVCGFTEEAMEILAKWHFPGEYEEKPSSDTASQKEELNGDA